MGSLAREHPRSAAAMAPTAWHPLLLLATLATASEIYDPSDFDSHPLVQAVEDALSSADCSQVNPDPDSYWMKQFLELTVAENMPQNAHTFADILPNLKRLAEYDDKGYLKAIAKGEMSPDALVFPTPDLSPLLIPAFIPVKYPPEELPTIVLEQIYNGQASYKEVINLRALEDDGEEGVLRRAKRSPQTVYEFDHSDHSDEIAWLDDAFHKQEAHEAKIVGGEIHERVRRQLPDNLAVYPPKNSMFAVETLCVKRNTDPNVAGDVAMPTS